jgi:hypothetical protein
MIITANNRQNFPIIAVIVSGLVCICLSSLPVLSVVGLGAGFDIATPQLIHLRRRVDRHLANAPLRLYPFKEATHVAITALQLVSNVLNEPFVY